MFIWTAHNKNNNTWEGTLNDQLLRGRCINLTLADWKLGDLGKNFIPSTLPQIPLSLSSQTDDEIRKQ